MALKQAEDVRQLQQQYELAVSQYEALEHELAETADHGDQTAADELYGQMQTLHPMLTTLFERLNAARSELAQARDENARATLA
jgi:hypothetical protein